MGLFDFLRSPDINQGIEEFHAAAARLQQMGYTSVKNIGGISAYRGKVEQSI